MEQIFGLPAHPLFIHFPAVAIPAVSLLAIVLAVVPRLRSTWGTTVAALGVATVISTFLAVASGHALAEALSWGPEYDERIATHRTLGQTLRWFVLGLVVSTTTFVALGRRNDTDPMPATPILRALVAVFAILSVIWAVRTGHEGARLNWDGRLTE